MKLLLNSRFIFLMIFLACAGVLVMAVYLEYFVGMFPCVLCWVQRILFALTGIICLIAAIHNPLGIGRRIYAFFALIFAALGIVAAGRQIWLTLYPDNSGCLPTTIEDIFANNPLFEAIVTAFKGTPECGLATDAFFGLELPYWGLISFCLFTLVLLFQLFRTNQVRLRFQQ